MRQKGRALFLLLLAAMVMPFSQLQAEDKTEPAAGQTYEDWGRRCETVKSTGETLCFIFQRLRVKENNQTVLFVTVGYPPKSEGPVMVLTTPLGVALMPGVQLQVDDQDDPVKVPYTICITIGCRASLALDEKLLAAMKKGEKLNVAFADAQGKGLRLVVSLNGFATANATLQP